MKVSLGTVGAGLLSVIGLFSPLSANAVPTLEAFGQLPMVRSVKMSPDGTHFAAVQTYKGAKVLVVYDMYGTPGKNAKVLAFDGSKKYVEELQRIFWANDTRLVAALEIPAMRWSTKVMETRMVAMNNDLSESRPIPRPNKVSKSKAGRNIGRATQIQDNVLHTLPDDPRHILIALSRVDYGLEENVYKLDVYSGVLKEVVSGNRAISGYMVDAAGAVRLRDHYRMSDHETVTELRGGSGSTWTMILSDETDGLGDYDALGFADDPDKLYVSKSGDGGRMEIHELDLPSRTITRKVFSHDRVDIGGLVRDENFNRVIGIWYQEHSARIVYFDPVWQDAQARVDALLPGRTNRLWSKDKTGAKWIVLSSLKSGPGTWYVYVKGANQLAEIGREYPLLMGQTLRPVEPFEFEARDGLKIPGYLTRPEGEGPFPTVVMPHGGPNGRTSMVFDYRVQFLASRGYAVLQPNFRGSTGYGKEFEEAGHHQWGLAMQDDITDATNTMIERGLADPTRICIVGSSYGGYAALMGAVKTPDLYQCAASFGGVSDVRKLLAYWDQFKFSDGNDPRIGDKWDDRGRIRDTAPINNVDAIKIPILLMHGENDRIVPAEQSKLMAARLKKAGKPHKLVVFKGGDHNHSFEKNRIQYLKELEIFLGKHIGE